MGYTIIGVKKETGGRLQCGMLKTIDGKGYKSTRRSCNYESSRRLRVYRELLPSERILARVAHVEEVVLIPIDIWSVNIIIWKRL